MADDDSEPPPGTNDSDVDREETLVSRASPHFLELPLSLFQINAVKPLIEAAKRNRKGLLFVSCAPDPPNAWRMQIVGLSQRGFEKVRRIIEEELK